jgi:hypothetical protein
VNAPGVGGLVSLLQNDMLDSMLGQIVADGKSCLSSAHDDGVKWPPSAMSVSVVACPRNHFCYKSLTVPV